MNSSVFALLAVMMSTSAVAQEKPPARYENWGVCPFECCTYREWTADDDIPLHRSRDDRSPVVFRLHQGETVDALTGVVVTVKPGVIHIDQSLQDGFLPGHEAPQLSLKAGDTVYMLSPLGEGSFLFWYQGKVYHSGNALAGIKGSEGTGSQMTWWKLIRNRSGQSGWTRSNRFRNVDACG